MTSGLRVSQKRKEKLFAKKVRNPTELNKSKFQTYNSIYNRLRRASKKHYFENQFNNFTKNSKKTWGLIRQIIGAKSERSQIPDYFKVNSGIIKNNLDIANGFNDFFSKIGPNLASEISDSEVTFDSYLSDSNPVSFNFSKISEMDILRTCNQLKPKLSSGIDFISNKLLKEIAPIIITPLHYLINLSFETGFAPGEFKIAKIVPIFKDGDCHNFTNYRPISLLSSFAKLMEKIVAKQLIGFLKAHNILYKHQYGFRAKHNTSQPVLHFVDKIFNALNQKQNEKTLSVFIDLKKAFDTVNHKILLKKMEHYGVRGTTNIWFSNYLSEREQFVYIDGIKSDKRKIICGVPQGSVLGPLLFLMFINDLPNATEFLTLLFADDTTFQITGQNIETLFEKCNLELEKAATWFKTNKLTLNVKKTKFMLFEGKKDKTNLEGLNLKIDDKIIDQVGSNCEEKYFKFVGHVLDDQLTWTGHIEHICKKLATANFAINSSKNFLPLRIRRTLYFSLFDSHLNFGSLLWGCAEQKLLKKIETLQKKCIRNVALKGSFSHSEPIFKELKILKFVDKISFFRALFMHQYRNNKLPVSFTNIFQDITNTDELQTRHNDYNYKNSPAVYKYLENFPYKKIITNWNSLSIELKATAEILDFQCTLKNKFLSGYTSDFKCTSPCYSCKT